MAKLNRKQYMLEVTPALQQNPKSVLTGHGISPTVLKMLITRPDLMAKLAAFIYSTKYAKKGINALKKQKNFKISGYRNFAEFNLKGRQDVERFMSQLAPNDQETFQNNENILVVVALPGGEVTGDLVQDIASGQSILTKFDTAVRKEQKSIGGFYLTIMWGDSAIRPQEEKVALSKAKRNQLIVERTQGTVAKIKRKLTSKQRKIASKAYTAERNVKSLQFRKNVANSHLDELNTIGQRFTGQRTDKLSDIKKAMRNYNTQTKRVLSALSPDDKAVYQQAVELMANGQSRKAKNLLARLGNADVTKIVLSGNLTSSDEVLSSRRGEIQAQISKLNQKSTTLVDRFENATTPRAKAQAKFDLRKNVEAVKILRARLKTTQDLSGRTKNNKINLIKRVNNAIATNMERGNSFRTSLNSALNALPIGNDIKQQIKQQVIQQVSNGSPAQFSVQQAIQQVPSENLQTIQAIQQNPVRKVLNTVSSKAGLAKKSMAKFLNKNNNKFGFQDDDLNSAPLLSGSRDIRQITSGNFNL